MKSFFLRALAAPLKFMVARVPPETPTRILVIRRNKMGDMICTLPLLHALRKLFPQAQLTVACDALGAAIARACPDVDEVILLSRGWNRWTSLYRDAAGLQNFDFVLAAKGGFDRRLALLTRLTHAPRRIGFSVVSKSLFFTDPVTLPENPHEEHQIETLLRLLAPMGSVEATPPSRITVPEAAQHQADHLLAQAPFSTARSLLLINLSSNRPIKFRVQDYAQLIRELLTPELAVGLIAVGADRLRLEQVLREVGSNQVAPLETPEVMDLAALLLRAKLFITPEGGAAHLSTLTGTPTLVLWDAPIGKWRPRSERHVLVTAEPEEEFLPVERLLQAIRKHQLLP